MKRLAVLMALAIAVTLGLAPMMGPTGTHASTPSKKVCKSKTVVKKVHGHKKRVKVRVCHTVKAAPKATPIPPLADVSGSQDLNSAMALGIILGPRYFCCFEQSEQTFLAPAHFQVAWSVNCSNAGDGTNYLAMFYVVGYDGTYQPEELYTGDNAGAYSGVANIDTTSKKRWAFVISDSAAQGCTYHLTAKRL